MSLKAFAIVIACAGGLIAVNGTLPSRAASDPCASKPSKYQRDKCREYNASAPGDEYFGKQKMSYLGINNTFHDSAIRAGSSTTDPAILGKMDQANDALQAWLKKYPNDPQLARSIFLAAEAYKKVWVKSAQDKAWTYMQLLEAKFPNTYFGKQVKKEMAIGFTQHWYTDPQPCGVTPAVTPAPPPPAKGKPKYQILYPPCISAASATPTPK